MLQEFWAVTVGSTSTSIYHVIARRGSEDPGPVATKIALAGESRVPVADELKGSMMLAITTQLQAYIPEGGGYTSFERNIESVNTRWWGDNSAPIVALFLTEAEAQDCFQQEDLQPCDSRWLAQTKEVIEKIGDDHPTITVCHYKGMSLLENLLA